jgi:hypothetical protein
MDDAVTLTSPETILESAERLCTTLERIGDGLIELDTRTLLDTEETLGRLVAVVASGGNLDNRAALEPLVRRGREALLRCRRLGASYTSVARVRLHLCTGVDTYDRTGGYAGASGHGATGSAVRASV